MKSWNVKQKENTRGFTLAEVMVTLFITVLITGAIVEVQIILTQQAGYQFSSLNSIDQVRYVGKQFSNEVRNAQMGVDGSYAIAQASTTQVIFFSPFGATSSSIVRRIRYYVASSTLYKGVITPSGSPMSYNGNTETVIPVVNNLVGTTTVFSYFDGTYAGTSSPLVQPINLAKISFIVLNLNIFEQNGKHATTTYTFSVGGSIRSLKTNLGN